MPTAIRFFATLLAGATLLAAQSRYDGPRPERADLPYLLHARTLLETEAGEAKQSTDKRFTLYTVAGATSPARTPVPEPIFIFKSDRINADRLTLYKMTVEKGARVIRFPDRPGKNSPKPVYLMVTPLEKGLFKVEVNEPIEDGEYCLTPEGVNTVYCFTTY
ncbi:MAG: hypothetical protein M9913_22250 [Bryobacteraceae bacterium]|nr:hypothetical protein [Solibacteraceae bacterium]MCO5353563.1 hypothetical protein [Bryobacteraceae bacterium]HAX45002.1 hypothetical protein [Bryobacterales bacterium]HRJ17953.1 hypothetical protein [Bryobacteraceae bacterium]